MVKRIVKMTFRSESCDEFVRLFEEYRSRIRNTAGCSHLELWRDKNKPVIFFTYSHWDRTESLDAYRNSAVFSEVWPKTKALFAAPAEAWTVEETENGKPV